MSIKCLAFDCFGTVFDMKSVPTEEIAAYVDHVRRNDFTPYKFPDSWKFLRAHRDSAEGIRMLQEAGYKCVTLSNGDASLLATASESNGIKWDHIIDLAKHRAYKPNNLDAYRSVEKDLGFKPEETMMVTANPTFGDVEGAAAVGMHSMVIRHGYPNTIIDLAKFLGRSVLSPVKRLERVVRNEDMSPDGQLMLLQQRDGDMIINIRPSKNDTDYEGSPFGVSVEFCVSGGRSPNTLNALRLLMIAMDKDNQEHPI